MTHSHLGDDATIRLDGFQCSKANTADELQISRGNPVAMRAALDGVGLPEAPAVRSGVPAAGVTGRKGKPRPTGKLVSEAGFRRMWFDSSLTLAEIGRELGIKQQAVSMRAATRGLPRRPARGAKPACDPELLAKLWLAHVAIDEISASLGCDPKTVRNTRKRLGLPERGPGRRARMITMADYRAGQLRTALAQSAREEQAALRNAEMVDGDPRRWAA